MHEFGHALGMVHEHQHPHRDQGIIVIKNNINLDWRVWFEKLHSQDLNFFGVEYDMDSIMHYASWVSPLYTNHNVQ